MYQDVMKNGKMLAQKYSRWGAFWTAWYRYNKHFYYIRFFNGKLETMRKF